MLNQGFHAINIQKKALDAAWLRQDILSNNIANVNTPGYKRQDVTFDTLLEDYLQGKRLNLSTTHQAHMTGATQTLSQLEAQVTTDQSTSLRMDGNNVNIDTEMAEIAKNSIKYNAIATELNAQIRRMKSAIRGGR